MELVMEKLIHAAVKMVAIQKLLVLEKILAKVKELLMLLKKHVMTKKAKLLNNL
jgi:hypothetical protein